VTWHTNPVKTLADAKGKAVTVSATGASSNATKMPLIFNWAVGTKFKVIQGYSTSGSHLAMERGEVDGICGLGYSTLLASNPDWILQKKLNILAQIGLYKHPQLPDVPMLLDNIQEERARKAQVLGERLRVLLEALEKEQNAAEQWLSELEEIFRDSCEGLLHGQQERFSEQSRAYLQSEIRKLFSKYDVLARPRRMVTQIIFMPLRLLGLGKRRDPQKEREVALAKLREKADLSPVTRILDQFNRKALESLSPTDPTSPLYLALRKPDIAITQDEARQRIWEEQERLLDWLQGTFQDLSKGIPKHKEWGIYSTSVLWGIFILSLEAAIGGGLGFLDAAVDSLLAPFVTKGATELFAYHELQTIARELSKRYQDGLLSVIEEQRDRYSRRLDALRTPPETMRNLEELRKTVSRLEKG